MCLIVGCGKKEEKNTNKQTLAEQSETEIAVETDELIDNGLFGAVYLKDENNQSIGYAVLENGTTKQLSNRTIYGYPELTNDRRHVVYRHTYPDDNGEYKEALFARKTSGEEVKLIDSPKTYKIGNNFAVCSSVDGVWYINGFEKPELKKIGDSLARVDYKSTLALNNEDKCTAFVADNGELRYVDLKNDKTVIVSQNVKYILKRIGVNFVYYVSDNSLYWWNGVETKQLLSFDEFKSLNANDSIIRIITDDVSVHYYITPKGNLIDISSIGKIEDVAMSENENYIACLSYSDSLTVCNISENGISDVELYEGEYTSVKVYDDGVVLAAKGGDEPSFGMIKSGEFKQIKNDFISTSDAEYYNGKVYYLDSGSVIEYTVGEATSKTVCTNVSENIKIIDGICYHLVGADSTGSGILHSKDCSVVDNHVIYFK